MCNGVLAPSTLIIHNNGRERERERDLAKECVQCVIVQHIAIRKLLVDHFYCLGGHFLVVGLQVYNYVRVRVCVCVCVCVQ